MSSNNNVSAKRSLTHSRTKAKASSKKKQQERQQLCQVQQSIMIKRFPTRLTDKQEIDRLKVCVAQTLAVMDKLLEFWTLGQCPFIAVNPDKPEPQRQPTVTITEPAMKPIDNDNHRSPYH